MTRENELERYQRALTTAELDAGKLLHTGSLFSLSFAPDIEAEYLSERAALNLTLQRYAVVLGAFLYLGFLIQDALAGAQYQQAFNYWLVFLVCIPSNFLMLAATFVERWRPRITRIAAVVALLNSMAMILASAVSFSHGHTFPPEAILIQQLYNVFLLGLPVVMATPVVVLNVALFALVHNLVGMPLFDLLDRSFLLATAGCLGLIGCYLHERTARTSWLRSRVLADLAEKDSLTGLSNRRVFYGRGLQLFRLAQGEKTPFAVVLVDLDHFKKINDQYGHPAGDACLLQIADLLRGFALGRLDVAARLGGEEFGLILSGATSENAATTASRFCSAIREASFPGGARLTASAGLVQITSDASFETLVEMADAALYRAKAAGRDCVRW